MTDKPDGLGQVAASLSLNFSSAPQGEWHPVPSGSKTTEGGWPALSTKPGPSHSKDWETEAQKGQALVQGPEQNQPSPQARLPPLCDSNVKTGRC